MATTSLETKRTSTARRAPSPPEQWPFGHLGELKKDPIGLLLRARSAHGDIVRLKFWAMTAHLLSHPDFIQHVLQRKQTAYNKDLMPLRRLYPVLGQGMVTADGEIWQRQRDVARPAFHRREIQSFGPAITSTAEALVDRWKRLAALAEPIDVHQEMMHVALNIAGRALFGVDLKQEAIEASRVLNVIMEAGQRRVRNMIALPMIIPISTNRQISRSRRALEKMIDRMIDQRLADTSDDHKRGAPDLFTRLLTEHDALEASRRSTQFYDEAITLLLAGHETTASALAFSLHLLGRHPRVMGMLRDEARAVLGGRAAAIEDLPRLPFTRMVIDESLRLYPPAWIMDRNAVDDDELGGYPIAKGSLLLMSPYVMHRHPAYWPDPERFDPRRFEKDKATKRPRHVYFPFSLGPRVCIGASFALTEAVMVLATLAAHVDVRLVDGHVLQLDPSITLRPKNGLPMFVQPLQYD
ncbi:MAG: cytochrome P450 [Pseudomonadota bacterium]